MEGAGVSPNTCFSYGKDVGVFIKDLEGFFNPRRIAVIGANENPGLIGYFIIRNMIGKGFKGVVYPINPHSESAQGVESYKTISHSARCRFGDIGHSRQRHPLYP